MNVKIIALIVVIVLAIAGASAFFILQNPSDNNNTNSNQTNGTNNTQITINNNTNNKNTSSVSAVLSGPDSASEGSSVTLTWKVKNTGEVEITNVSAGDQNEDFDFGTIKPGETKTHTYTLYIPTSEGVKIDFGENATVSNPFYVGGFGLSYSVNGHVTTTNSNSIKIPLN
ncbi:MAG: hypothetical protein FWE58_00835 [Methanobrevibacter sp.]|nr:hypothetical protein [Methanobrevibacter sp.]